MKIIRLSTFLDYGGIESKMINLSTYQDDENEWIFCALGKGGAAEENIKQNKKRVICFNKPHKIPSISGIITLYKFFRNEMPDIVHTSGAEANFHGLIASKLARVPLTVIEEIGIPSQSNKARIIFKILYSLADLILGESKAVTVKLKNLYKVNEQKLKEVPNFCLFSTKDSVNKNGGDSKFFRIVSVSRLEPVKNINAVIKVVSRLKAEGYKIKYNVLGDGSSMEVLKQMVINLKLDEDVQFIGYVKDTKRYLLESDLYILNSFSEGFSNSLLEAMYLETPSISTNVGAADEIIDDNCNGWIIDVNNEDRLFEKIRGIIHLHKDVRTAIGQNGKQTIIQNYSLQSHINILMSLYHRDD